MKTIFLISHSFIQVAHETFQMALTVHLVTVFITNYNGTYSKYELDIFWIGVIMVGGSFRPSFPLVERVSQGLLRQNTLICTTCSKSSVRKMILDVLMQTHIMRFLSGCTEVQNKILVSEVPKLKIPHKTNNWRGLDFIIFGSSLGKLNPWYMTGTKLLSGDHTARKSHYPPGNHRASLMSYHSSTKMARRKRWCQVHDSSFEPRTNHSGKPNIIEQLCIPVFPITW